MSPVIQGWKRMHGYSHPALERHVQERNDFVGSMSLRWKGNGYMQDRMLHDNAAFALLLGHVFGRLWKSGGLGFLAGSALD